MLVEITTKGLHIILRHIINIGIGDGGGGGGRGGGGEKGLGTIYFVSGCQIMLKIYIFPKSFVQDCR